MNRTLHALRRRLNATAHDLVNEELARVALDNERLQSENDELRRQLAWAESSAESWREDAVAALSAQSEAAGRPLVLTQSGHLMVAVQ